jgi:iduronate 2-sulfatase
MKSRFLLPLFSVFITFTGNARQKNVLFIAVDDLKPLLNCYGAGGIHSPNIDKLAEKGTVFTNSQCQQAVCSPSRASLMFGIRPDKTKIWDLQTPVRTATENRKTVPEYFKGNGYETAAFGKIFHISMADKGHDMRSWTISYQKINIENYPEELGSPFGGHFQDPKLKKEMEDLYSSFVNQGEKPGSARAKTLDMLKVSTEMLEVTDEAYQDGQIARNAVNLIDQLASKDKPFFIAVGFKKPHLPFVAPKKYWDFYNRENIDPANWQKAPIGAPDFALHQWGELKSYSDIEQYVMPSGVLNEEKQRELIHGYMACVSYTDAQIGKLLDKLAEKGIAENTIVVLWGDHGWHLGDHGLWCKHSNFEQATRAPLIISSPGLKGNHKNASPVEFVDIYPTLCELAGLGIPEDLDGISLKPIVSGEKEKVKDFAISQYPRGNFMGYSLRNERYRYTAWFNIDYRAGEKGTKQNLVAEELYDYAKDPDETINLCTEKDYAGIYKKLSEELLTFLN